MERPKINVDGEWWDVIQIIFLPQYTDPFEEVHREETVYIEYGKGYNLVGQIYIALDELDFNKPY